MEINQFSQFPMALELLKGYLLSRKWDGITDNRLHTFLTEQNIIVMVQPSSRDDLSYSVDDRVQKDRFFALTGINSYSEAYWIAFTKGMEMLNRRLSVKQ